MNNDIFSKYVNKDQEKIKQKGRKKLFSFPGHNGIKSILASIFYSNASSVSRDSLHDVYIFLLTDSIFETGAYGVPSKSLTRGGICDVVMRHTKRLLPQLFEKMNCLIVF